MPNCLSLFLSGRDPGVLKTMQSWFFSPPPGIEELKFYQGSGFHSGERLRGRERERERETDRQTDREREKKERKRESSIGAEEADISIKKRIFQNWLVHPYSLKDIFNLNNILIHNCLSSIFQEFIRLVCTWKKLPIGRCIIAITLKWAKLKNSCSC